MAKPESQTDVLRTRLSGLLAAWETEISAVIRELESQLSSAAIDDSGAQTIENQANELAQLQQRVRDRDIALDHLNKKAKEKDAKYAELEREHKKTRARADELERKLGALDESGRHEKDGQRAEFDAMRAELAARKSLVKSLRTDASRGKALEKELAANRAVIATLKQSIDRDARTIEELRRSSDSWERKYRRLIEASSKESSRDSDAFSESSVFTKTALDMLLDETPEVDGAHTVVIDMTEPLREARDERRRKHEKR